MRNEIPRRTTRTSPAETALMEPAIIVLAGSVVGLIVAAAMLPIFNLAKAIK